MIKESFYTLILALILLRTARSANNYILLSVSLNLLFVFAVFLTSTLIFKQLTKND